MTVHRRTATLAITLAALWALTGTARADHHETKITELYTGSADPKSEYVELQMYADGENHFVANGAALDYYNADGTLADTTSFAMDPIGGNQRKVLVINNQAYLEFVPPIPDALLGDADRLQSAGGAVCFKSNTPPFNVLPFIDCVSYGNFVNTPNLPVGTAAPAPTATQSIHRTIAPNCPTQLDAADDTNDSSVDFALGTPSPTPSTVGPNLPTCTPPGTPPPSGGGGSATGQRAAALKKCKKKKSNKARKKCKKKTLRLPV
jgi:hypothetical protein